MEQSLSSKLISNPIAAGEEKNINKIFKSIPKVTGKINFMRVSTIKLETAATTLKLGAVAVLLVVVAVQAFLDIKAAATTLKLGVDAVVLLLAAVEAFVACKYRRCFSR
ncbi:hypothetical protein WN944_016441 [Citrus x changshan-huyou]|uniref:Uncharacterized protein n=1 Tax=Citrus x changshan-huyou TaxID=2935761 RepID=A0AAP0MFS9_9ROSI